MVEGTMGGFLAPFFLSSLNKRRLGCELVTSATVAFLLVEQPNLFTTNWHFQRGESLEQIRQENSWPGSKQTNNLIFSNLKAFFDSFLQEFISNPAARPCVAALAEAFSTLPLKLQKQKEFSSFHNTCPDLITNCELQWWWEHRRS